LFRLDRLGHEILYSLGLFNRGDVVFEPDCLRPVSRFSQVFEFTRTVREQVKRHLLTQVNLADGVHLGLSLFVAKGVIRC